MARASASSAVTIASRPLWLIRLSHALPRYLVGAACVAGLAASARFAIAPPRPRLAAPTPRPELFADPAAEGFATLFARRYLSWNTAEPGSNQRALEPFVGSTMEPDAGLRLPASGEQHVEWAEVVQAREPVPGEHVYTVAAQTDTAGLLYLTVSVVRTGDGSLALAGYPAFVGAPASASPPSPEPLREVVDQSLATVVERALRNYLAASAGELAADLTSDAHVSLPALPLDLQSVQRLDWSPGGRSVIALVQAEDGRGAQYLLSYELDVARLQGRWEVSAVATDPDA
jgi:Conjugative transposon protein TcpC